MIHSFADASPVSLMSAFHVKAALDFGVAPESTLEGWAEAPCDGRSAQVREIQRRLRALAELELERRRALDRDEPRRGRPVKRCRLCGKDVNLHTIGPPAPIEFFTHCPACGCPFAEPLNESDEPRRAAP